MKILLLIFTLTLVYGKDFDFDADFDVNFDLDEPELQPPIVKIADGALKGQWETTTKGRQYAMFEGIPYAKPPVGQLRFKAPQPADPWRGIFNATRVLFSHCLQFDPFFKHVSGREDCLAVNVYSPRVDSSAAMPVMVFIHGGAFFYGAGYAYDPERLMDRDMVVVTFNYRVGPLGFLSTGDKVIPGNMGLKDQALVLHWVQKNIRAFGGDPASVTLAGFSSGAASLHYLYLSPLARGTFHRGIAFSGSAFAPWAFASKPAEKAKQLAALVDCPTETSQGLADCLMSKKGEEILQATVPMFDQNWFTVFVPTAEPEGLEGAFLTKHPYEATKAGEMYNVPLLATTTSDEGLYPAASFVEKVEKISNIENQWEEFAAELFHYNDTVAEDQRKIVAAKIKKHCLEPYTYILSVENVLGLIKAMGDRNIIAGVGKMAEMHAAISKQPVHLYRYSFASDTTFAVLMGLGEKFYGVSHGDDVFHIFNLPLITAPDESQDREMYDVLVDMVYTYCKDGIPKLPKNAPEWATLIPGSPALNYLEISSPKAFEMKKSIDFGQRAFWDSLGFNEDQNYKRIL